MAKASSNKNKLKKQKNIAKTTREHKYSKVFILKFSNIGLSFGALFFAFSLFPSMLPRNFILQSVVSAITLVIGYGIGTFFEWMWHYLQIPPLKGRTRKIIVFVLLVLIVFSVLSASKQAVGWQNSVREQFGLGRIGILYIVEVYGLTIILSALFLIIGRSIRKLYQFLSWQFSRFVPRRVAIVFGVIVVFMFVNFLYTGVLAKTFFAVTNQMFSAADVKISPKFKQPTSELRSGSTASLVKWDNMGVQGRKFVATGPSGAEISSFSGVTAKEPIRVFAGLGSAKNFDERAKLVLDELKRTGAFERKSLLITTSTGTGWIDPKSVEPFEYINNGDSAVAGMQYSYLPSWISLLADQQTVKNSSRILFSTIYDYWSGLPAETRPKLYLYGLSLGSFGVEEVLNNVEFVNEPVSGAVLAGPPFVNELHRSLENSRNSDSPAWQPIINNGSTVRFTSSEDALDKPAGNWGKTKIVYLQHATDPIVWFSQDLLARSPDWLEKGQRGPGITKDFVWVPIVTMWQMAADLPAAGSVKDGFGHNYAVTSNIDIWSALVNPEGWTAEKTEQLKKLLVNKKYEGA